MILAGAVAAAQSTGMMPPGTGRLIRTEASDTLVATGMFLPASVGTASIVETGDSLSATGNVPFAGSGAVSITEAADTLAATGTMPAPLTTWNPADKNAGITLSDSDRTATLASGSSYRGVRGVLPLTAGTHVFTFLCGNRSADTEFGVANLSSSLANYGGADNHSIAYYGNTGNVWRGNASIGSAGSYNAGTNPQMEIDMTAKTARFRPNSGAGWSTAFDITALGATVYLHYSDSATGDAMTITAHA